RFDSRGTNNTVTTTQGKDASNESPISNASSLPETRIATSSILQETVRNLSEVPDATNHERRLDEAYPLPTPSKRRRTEVVPQDGDQFFPASPAGSGASVVSPWSNATIPTGRVRSREDDPPIHSPQAISQGGEQFSPSAGSYHTTNQDQEPLRSIQVTQPTDGIQEACLLRYFVEELSPWVTCPTDGYKEYIVNRMRSSISAMMRGTFSWLSRGALVNASPFVTPSSQSRRGISAGIQNSGRNPEPLPDLTPQSAFEYMLRCIPALHEVSRTQDEEYRENLAAAALILRQFEEMDPEDAQSAGSSDPGNGNGNSNVNFLEITKAILRAAPSRWSRLLSAVYWVAVRQEIYFALTLGRSPQITAQPDQGREASFANKLIWFMSEVAKWKMGERLESEWERLRGEKEALALECARQFIPIMQRPADRSRGEIFPLIWYASDVEVTALQHFILAKMILVAEDPSLCRQGSNRRAQRDAEHQVRAMTLELCGLALHHLRAAPNLTTAGMGIMLYGDYFNDPWESAALTGILGEWKSHHAWPVRKGFQALGITETD
ncbi:hypothetical protein CSPAE12_04414, partial [Colletotrichum incanum]